VAAVVGVVAFMYFRSNREERREARGGLADMIGGCGLVLALANLLLCLLGWLVYRLAA
jgi:hypothetical protein